MEGKRREGCPGPPGKPLLKTSKAMKASEGILTVRGGMTSHAAVVARGMGICCVSGCSAITMDEENKKFELAGKTYHEGDYISIDGSTGNVYDGIIPRPSPRPSAPATSAASCRWLTSTARWLSAPTRIPPRTRSMRRDSALKALALCRTEHMFFEGDRIGAIREMICADTVEGRKAALCETRTDAAGRLRKTVRDDGRPAGQHPLPRPAAP